MNSEKYTNLGTVSFFIKISNRHAWAEAEVFSGDHAVCVFLQVLDEVIEETEKRAGESDMFLASLTPHLLYCL